MCEEGSDKDCEGSSKLSENDPGFAASICEMSVLLNERG